MCVMNFTLFFGHYFFAEKMRKIWLIRWVFEISPEFGTRAERCWNRIGTIDVYNKHRKGNYGFCRLP